MVILKNGMAAVCKYKIIYTLDGVGELVRYCATEAERDEFIDIVKDMNPDVAELEGLDVLDWINGQKFASRDEALALIAERTEDEGGTYQ